MLGETVDKHMDKHFKACKSAEALDNGLLCSEKFLGYTESFVQTKTMKAIADQCKVNGLGFTYMDTGAENNAAGAADANLGQKELTRTSSGTLCEESYNGHWSHQTRHSTCRCKNRNQSNKSGELESTVLMGYINFGRNVRLNRCKERMNLSKSDPDHSSQANGHENYKKGTALKVPLPVNDRYKKAFGIPHIPPCEYYDTV